MLMWWLRVDGEQFVGWSIGLSYGALVSLPKDLSVSDHPGHTVQL